MALLIPKTFPEYSFFNNYTSVFGGVKDKDTNVQRDNIIFFREQDSTYYFLANNRDVTNKDKTVLGKWEIKNDSLVINITRS